MVPTLSGEEGKILSSCLFPLQFWRLRKKRSLHLETSFFKKERKNATNRHLRTPQTDISSSGRDRKTMQHHLSIDKEREEA